MQRDREIILGDLGDTNWEILILILHVENMRLETGTEGFLGTT